MNLRFEGKKQLDSRGLGNVHLTLEDGRYKRTIIAESTISAVHRSSRSLLIGIAISPRTPT